MPLFSHSPPKKITSFLWQKKLCYTKQEQNKTLFSTSFDHATTTSTLLKQLFQDQNLEILGRVLDHKTRLRTTPQLVEKIGIGRHQIVVQPITQLVPHLQIRHNPRQAQSPKLLKRSIKIPNPPPNRTSRKPRFETPRDIKPLVVKARFEPGASGPHEIPERGLRTLDQFRHIRFPDHSP
ncbi:Ras-specific guanine nucleotide-releasing factor [Striga asiatica]|uniref:Ras-specific guanine nucleotide-releasing factor n=1 Tax=Striga asiatica TaxID=4170 RepID=A0A5A7R832_STRAF|nr:Ras-specific guanine nucleotide-releasing factor [Striga asiatica]